MDWIEQWFGVAPDNGDGTLELLIWLVVAAVIVSAAAWLHRIWQAPLGQHRPHRPTTLVHPLHVDPGAEQQIGPCRGTHRGKRASDYGSAMANKPREEFDPQFIAPFRCAECLGSSATKLSRFLFGLRFKVGHNSRPRNRRIPKRLHRRGIGAAWGFDMMSLLSEGTVRLKFTAFPYWPLSLRSERSTDLLCQ